MSPALLLVPVAQQCWDSTVGRGWRGHPCRASPSTTKQGSLGNWHRCSRAPPCPPLYAPSLWDEPGWGSRRAVGWAGAVPWLLTAPSTCSRLHSNHLFCDCHLAWLSQWLRQRPTIGLFTQCAAPAQLRGLNVAEIQKNEFSCSGEGDRGGGGRQGRDTGQGDKACPINAAHLHSLPHAPAQSLDACRGLSSGQHCPWCGDNMGTTPPYQCDKGRISLCPWSCVPFAQGWSTLGPCAPAQGCHELSQHTELSPGSLPWGAATHPPGPALCNSHAGRFPGRTNGPDTCPALQLVLWLLPGHVHLQQRHRGLSGQGADSHPRQPA